MIFVGVTTLTAAFLNIKNIYLPQVYVKETLVPCYKSCAYGCNYYLRFYILLTQYPGGSERFRAKMYSLMPDCVNLVELFVTDSVIL